MTPQPPGHSLLIFWVGRALIACADCNVVPLQIEGLFACSGQPDAYMTRERLEVDNAAAALLHESCVGAHTREVQKPLHDVLFLCYMTMDVPKAMPRQWHPALQHMSLSQSMIIRRGCVMARIHHLNGWCSSAGILDESRPAVATLHRITQLS